MSPKLRILTGLATLMFIVGLVYGAMSGTLALSATADDSSTSSFSGSGSNGEGSAQESGSDRDGGACLSDPSVLEEIRSQREGIAKAQKELAAKEQELKDREKAMAEELKKVEAIRDEINKTDELRKKENEEKVAKVIETLGTMSPKASAKMLAELDDALAVEVLVKMDTSKLAKIMNLLEPKRASALTEMLAGVTRAKAANAQHLSMAADPVTGRDGVRTTSNQKGGENYDGQNQDNSNTSSSRKPSSIESKGSSGNVKGRAQKGNF
jgi:flagellar motility protein MotE (MotC chaperone)